MSWLRHNQEYQKRITRSFKAARDRRKEYESEYLSKAHQKTEILKKNPHESDGYSPRTS